MMKTSFPDISTFFPSFPTLRDFFPRGVKEAGNKCERSFINVFIRISLIYIFFHIYLKNKEEKKRKPANNKGMAF